MNQINNLPVTIPLDDEGHIEDHEVIHAGLKDHEQRIASTEGDMIEVKEAIEDIETDLGAHEYTWESITEKPETFDPSTHSHPISQITDLQSSLDSKAAAIHSHSINSITNLQTTLDGKASSDHTHEISNITNLQTTLSNKADLVNSKIPTSQIPALALTKPFPVTDREEMLALTAEEGDVAIITGDGVDKGTYMLGSGPSDTYSSWIPLAASTEVPVQSVNGQIGTVVLGPLDIGAAKENHSHTISDISNLQDALDNAGSNDAAELTGALTDQVDANEAMVNYEYDDVNHRMPLKELLNGLLYMSEALGYKSDWDHTHDGADITGALTDQVDVSAAMVDLYSGVTGEPTTLPVDNIGVAVFSETLIFVSNVLDDELAGKADADLSNATVSFIHPVYGALSPAFSDWVQGLVDENAQLRADLDAKENAHQYLTQAQYDALATKDPAVTYNILESE